MPFDRKAWKEQHREELRAQERARYAKNPEKFRAKAKEYQLKNREKIQQNHLAHPEVKQRYNSTYRANHREKLRLGKVEYRLKLRADILTRYGGSCICCGEAELDFLTLDHINGDGRRDREMLGSGLKFYLSLKDAPLRTDLRVLCMNCNWAIGMRGYCPHGNLSNQRLDGNSSQLGLFV